MTLTKGDVMNSLNINNKGQALIFKNRYLEMLTKTQPWVIYSIYIPLVIFLVYYAWSSYHYSIMLIFWLLLISMLTWTFFEYLVHRFLFHFQASSTFGKRMVYIFHENHHEFPRDKTRLFMPPVPSLIMAFTVLILFYGVSILLFSSGGYALVFFSGFISGYLIYVSIHYAIHAFQPPKYLKVLWRNHHLHHYKHPDKAFGVSSMLWDTLFGTLPDLPEKKAAQSGFKIKRRK
ncbi:sterol desaturase family protein [Pedobacter gandavensis]|uniref:sterol desaturase family protein n=1 Tax=Pedobacter gandavensis TaxID=2679963 RepID=UPI00247987A7|nr:sterol desaturase family protein [Pedobacter gandavensis]WGQ10922.1 sterol desaturase family protein [Pedobacter gandavensis]